MSIMETFSAAKDRVSAAGASVKTFLADRTPQAQLAEISAEIGAAEGELARLAGERKRFVVPKLTGDPEAAEMVQQIDQQSDALQLRLKDLRPAKAQVEAAVRAAETATRRAEAAARPGRMAAARERIFDLAQEIDRAGDALAAAIKAALAEIADLAAVADSTELARWTATAARQIRNGLAARFDINSSGPKRAENNLLGLVSGWGGEKAHWTVGQLFAEILDNTVPHFASEAAAEECRQRQAQRGNKTVVLKLAGGTFMVIRTDAIFAERSAAEATLASGSTYRTAKAVIVPWRDAFVIVPAGIAGAVPA